MGVAWSLAQEGVHVGGFELSLAGDVPLGAGLSSSASIEVATALALLALADAEMPLATIALACQRAENAFVGARSGIMDQFIACAGQ
jgi:galactokinase